MIYLKNLLQQLSGNSEIENFARTQKSKLPKKNFAQISFVNRNYARFLIRKNITCKVKLDLNNFCGGMVVLG